MNILITGATGFVGRTLVNRLLKDKSKYKLSIMLLHGEKVPDFVAANNLTVHNGDITNASEVQNAVEGSDIVIHLAGFISYWNQDIPKLKAINVEGVRNIVEASIQHNVKRLIHISSVGSIGFNMDGTSANEDTAYNWPESLPYMTTKKMGEDVVSDAVRKHGLNAVILNPASIMGPGDPSPKTAHNMLYGNIYNAPFFFGTFTGGLAVVDVRDLCQAIEKTIDNGESGERYLIVGANTPYSKVLQLIGKYSKKLVIPFPIPPFIFTIAGMFMEMISRVTKKRPLLTSGYGKLSGWVAYYSNEKSKNILGVSYRDLEETIEAGCRYYESEFL